jgi:PAS domain S-box-containing protein
MLLPGVEYHHPKHQAGALLICRHAWSVPFLRKALLICMVIALWLPVYHWAFVVPAHRQLLTSLIEEHARRASVQLVRHLQFGLHPLEGTALPMNLQDFVADLKADLKLDKVKLIAPSGQVIFSTEAQEVGTRDNRPLPPPMANGQVYSQVVQGGKTPENAPLQREVAQVLIPILSDHNFLGAVEIHYDITAARTHMQRLLLRSGVMVTSIALALVSLIGAILLKAGSAMLAHHNTADALRKVRDELEMRVMQRTGELIRSNEDLQQKISERQQAEAALRESEERFRMLIETIPHGIREIDTTGRITFVNSAHARIYGYSEEELIGKSMLDLSADDEERRQFQAHLSYLLDQLPRPSPWFGRERTKGGRIIDVQVDWNYKVDTEGRILGLITVISDITHRKQAEKALLDNIKFMNTLIDTIPNPVFFKDEKGVFLGCNVAYAQTVGLPKDQILGRRVIDLTGITFKDMAEHYHRQDLLMITSPGIRIHEDQLIAATGEQRDYILFKASFRDAEGHVAGLVGIMLDITARKKVEKELKESQNLFEAFMHHLPGLAFMKNHQGQYIFVNRAFTKFTGAKTAELLGRCDHQVWDAGTAQQLQQNDQTVLGTRAAANLLETVRLPDLQERYLLTTRFPIFQEDELTALGGVAIDVTERTEAEHRRQQLERQLQQAQKMEALGTLAGGIAHDFNNILASIIGYTQIALSEIEKDSALHDYLKRVLAAGERAGDLVKQILTFSRKSEIEPTPVRIKVVLKEVLKLVRATLPVTVEMVHDVRSEAVIMADPVQIHQVMMNLCANAGYAMRSKGGKLTVSLTDEVLDVSATSRLTGLKPGPFIKLSVSDTGTGIAAEHVERIFDPFFTTKPKGEGTGMGLAVVHGIVSGLGGVVTVQSVAGQGACFDVLLPALEGEFAAVQGRPSEMPTGTERILLVDDEVFQTDMLKHMLGLLGYQTQACNSGSEALLLLQQDPSAFDLVITDMVMPGMTGDALSVRILRLRPEQPIILCTGYSDNITEEKAKTLGIRAFALKPLIIEELAQLIRKVIDEKM